MDFCRPFEHEADTEMASPISPFSVDPALISSEPASPSYHRDQQHDWNSNDNFFSPLSALPAAGDHENNNQDFNVQRSWGFHTTRDDEDVAYSPPTLGPAPHHVRLQQINQAPGLQRSISQPLPDASHSQSQPQPTFTRGGLALGTPMNISASTPSRRGQGQGQDQGNNNTNAPSTTPSKKKARTSSRSTSHNTRGRNAAPGNSTTGSATGSPTPNGVAKKPRRPPPTSIPIEWIPPPQIQPVPTSNVNHNNNNNAGGLGGAGAALGISSFDFAADAANDMISPRTVVPMSTHFNNPNGTVPAPTFGQAVSQHGAQTGHQWYEPNMDPSLLRMSLSFPNLINGVNEPATAYEARLRASEGGKQHTLDAGLAVLLHDTIARISGECDRLRDVVNRCVSSDAGADMPANGLSETERARHLARNHNATLSSPHAALAPLPHTHAESPTWSMDMHPATAADIGSLDHEQLDALLLAHNVAFPNGAFLFEKKRALMTCLGCAREMVAAVLD